MPARKARRRLKGTGSIEPLPSGRFRARINGVKPEVFDSELDADLWFGVQRKRMQDEKINPPPPETEARTVSELISEWQEVRGRRWKPATRERYDDHAAHIRRLLGDLPATQLDARRMDAFLMEMGRVHQPKTVAACNGVLRSVLRHAHRYGDIPAMPPPAEAIDRVKRPTLTIPTRAQVDALALASDARCYALVLLAGYCGLREGEILGLHQADVNLDEEWVFVHQQRNRVTGKLDSTKTEGVRRVAFYGPVGEALRIHLAEYPGELVAPMTTGSSRWPEPRPFTARLMRRSWVKARAKVDLPGVRFHDLRHAAASMMIAAGLNVRQVSAQLGHANPTETLNTYSHLWPDSLDDARRRMNAYLAA